MLVIKAPALQDRVGSFCWDFGATEESQKFSIAHVENERLKPQP